MAREHARQLRDDVGPLPALPASHAWRRGAGQLLTKARCMGIVVAVAERAERVEYLLDDGSGLVKAVRWDAGPPTAALGDLVEVEGKLSANVSADADPEHARELRVVRMSRIEDPNEEALHWAQAMELAREFYQTRAAADTRRGGGLRQSPRGSHEWEAAVRLAFFELRVDSVDGDDQRARVVRGMLELLLGQQRQMLKGGHGSVRTSFAEVVRHLEAEHSSQGSASDIKKNAVSRDVRFVFRMLRSMGLLFLEDEETDRHELLSYDGALRPAIVDIVSGRLSGVAFTDVVDELISQPRFQSVPLTWMEHALSKMIADGYLYTAQDLLFALPGKPLLHDNSMPSQLQSGS